MVAADGEHRWLVYADRVAVGPAVLWPASIADLLDPAWMLDWGLTGGQPVRLNDRAGFLVRIHRPGRSAQNPPQRMTPAVAVVDAELGILLRLTVCSGGRPYSRHELRQLVSRAPRDPSEFVVPIPAGTPTVADTGRMLDEANAPPWLKTAGNLAGRALTGAMTVGSIADQIRRRKSGRDGQSGPG